MPALFEGLRDRLLRAGVAPRHVKRYLIELAEHLEDVIAEEKRAGRDSGAAEKLAFSRLGDVDSLAKAMIANKQFLSWSYRAPWAAFGLGPLITLLGLNILTVLPLGVIVWLYGSAAPGVPVYVPSWFDAAYAFVTNFDLFGLPLLLGWAIASLAVRQRMRPLWPLFGLVVVAIFCGSQHFMIVWSSAPRGLNSLGMGWAFLPPFRISAEVCFRVLLNLGLTGTVYFMWRARQRPIAAQDVLTGVSAEAADR